MTLTMTGMLTWLSCSTPLQRCALRRIRLCMARLARSMISRSPLQSLVAGDLPRLLRPQGRAPIMACIQHSVQLGQRCGLVMLQHFIFSQCPAQDGPCHHQTCSLSMQHYLPVQSCTGLDNFGLQQHPAAVQAQVHPQQRRPAAATQTAKSGTIPPLRHTVLEIHDSADERVLRLLDAASGTELAAHLRDGWQATPAHVGDTVHVLARVDVLADGSRHALCDHSQGEGLQTCRCISIH